MEKQKIPTNVPDDDEDMFVAIEMEDGSTVESKVLTIFEVKEQDYIVLLPLDEHGKELQDGTVYIYRYFEDADGNPSMENILSDEEYGQVEERFDELLDEAAFDEM